MKATVTLDDGAQVTVVWWDAGLAPSPGDRVKVRGTAREYNGAVELHVVESAVARHEPPEDPVKQLIGFYIGCVEAEAAGSVRVRPGSEAYLELSDGPNPVLGPRRLPPGKRVDRWCAQREMALGESVLAGWPMVVGIDHDAGTAGPFASPLLTAEVGLARLEGGWSVEPDGAGIDMNPYALDLLGLDRDERDVLARLVESTPSVEEARTPHDRASAILRVLSEAGIEGLEGLPADELGARHDRAGIHNTAMLLTASGSTRITRMLLEDLEELLNQPHLLSDGPAAVMLGLRPAPGPSLPRPFPTVVPSSLAQDQAVTSAMDSSFTVVTGPPGTGKSQVLVNVVAAAASRNQTVLFASKNNQAVDVVFERLALTSTEPCIVRAGSSSRRNEVAASITRVLGTPAGGVDATSARKQWAEVEGRVGAIHDVARERERLHTEIARMEAEVGDRIEALGTSVRLDVGPAQLAGALAGAGASLDAFGGSLGLFRRWERHRRRLEHARQALGGLADLIGLERRVVEAPLQAVVDKPKRTLAPRHAFGAVEGIVEAIRRLGEARATIARARAELDALPSKQGLDDRLAAIGEERNRAGRALLDARWAQLRRGDRAALQAAGELAEILAASAGTGRGARRARGLVPAALGAVPVWGVTNLSARTNLPLVAGLFDLVVIDEASQCDVASALPLLVRARRALIIGDQRQLIHITSLGQEREQAIGRRWGLSDDRVDEFSYRSRSCFGMASGRVGGSPVFLDLHFRSHPAIIGFSNERFYGGRLEMCASVEPPAGMPAIEWVRVEGDTRRGRNGSSFENLREAEMVAQVIARDTPTLAGLGLSSGVVTPYRAQAELIRDRLRDILGGEAARWIPVATAHRFQGDERDVMYFSPVVGPSLVERQVRFAADPNLVNVALTRARRRLVIVGNMEACLHDPTDLAALARYVSRLEAGSFDSPLEMALHGALLDRGVAAVTGVVVAGHRLDLAVERDGRRLDIECDGAAFHVDRDADSGRDREVRAEGWEVIRFSGRRLSTDLTACVDDVVAALGG